MSEIVYGLTAESANILEEMANEHRQRLPAVGRRTRRVGLTRRSAGLTILGPCSSYTPAVELADSTYDIDFGGGCLGPSRFGLILKNLDNNVIQVINLELTTGLTYESESFSYACASSTKTVTAELVFTDLEVDGATLTIYQSATPITTYMNSIYRFFPLVGSYLQIQTSPCDCVTFPYDACIAPPTR